MSGKKGIKNQTTKLEVSDKIIKETASKKSPIFKLRGRTSLFQGEQVEMFCDGNNRNIVAYKKNARNKRNILFHLM